MRALWLSAVAFILPAVPPSGTLPPNYEKNILAGREEQAKDLDGPDSWLSLVALQQLTAGDVSVGSAPGNTVHLQHGLPHAFTLHVTPGHVAFAAVDPTLTLGEVHPKAGDPVPSNEDQKSTLHWGDLWANVIKRTGNQTYLRIGDPYSPNRLHFHGLKFYPVNPAYRITAKWIPYTTPHEIRMGTVLGTTLSQPSAGYAEFVQSGQTIRLDGTESSNEQVTFSFRDGTAKTTTYGAGRHVTAERPSNGLKSPGSVVIDFNLATNWPCAYTEYGTCPLPPPENRFSAEIPAGEKRYHD